MSRHTIAQPGLPARSRTNYRWVIMVLIFLVYTMAPADRANIGIVLPFLKNEFGMTNTEAGRGCQPLLHRIFRGADPGRVPGEKVWCTRRVFPVFMALTSIFTGLLHLLTLNFRARTHAAAALSSATRARSILARIAAPSARQT